MKDYTVFVDSACDISPKMLAEWGVKCISLSFSFDGENVTYNDDGMSVKEFYQKMRDGFVAHTSAINVDTFLTVFEPELAAGNDVIYLAFSSGLSSTYSSAVTAAAELREKYPDRILRVVDSLAASAGYGLLLRLALNEKEKGAGIDEVANFCENMRDSICHWFTVDDLKYLRRGGRISATAAVAGAVLGIKPVLHVDDEGHLINMMKIRGRKASVKALADKFGELKDRAADGTVFISNGDCLGDAESLAEILKSEYGVKVSLITDIGPVIGAHSGPGTLALFFVGTHK